jgi:uracil-DNA glycosylase family 4
MTRSAASYRWFDPRCRDCTRLAAFLKDVRKEHPDYHAAPVAPFGDANARLLIVGLAPGKHGAARTGRPFTGDHAGILLYRTLYRFGFSSCEQSVAADDALQLIGCRITNAVKCLPPQNKPETAEVQACNRFLAAELSALRPDSAIVALGAIAHRAVLLAYALPAGKFPFRHGAVHHLPSRQALFDSYHCSRYNTQTNRLTVPMFEAVFAAVAAHLQPT